MSSFKTVSENKKKTALLLLKKEKKKKLEHSFGQQMHSYRSHYLEKGSNADMLNML